MGEIILNCCIQSAKVRAITAGGYNNMRVDHAPRTWQIIAGKKKIETNLNSTEVASKWNCAVTSNMKFIYKRDVTNCHYR